MFGKTLWKFSKSQVESTTPPGLPPMSNDDDHNLKEESRETYSFYLFPFFPITLFNCSFDFTVRPATLSLQLPGGIRARASPFSLAATGGISVDFFSSAE